MTTPRNILTRLANVEERVGMEGEAEAPRIYFCQGPMNFDGHEYLRSLGYELAQWAIVVCFVAPGEDLEPMDLTPKHAPQNALLVHG